MTRKRKIATWIALVFSVPATYYAATSVIFYAWLNAAEPERWPAERAAVWVCSALALTVVFLGLFIYCVASLVRNSNKSNQGQTNAT